MAATVPQDRLAGFQGAIYLGGIKILDIFDWNLECTQEVVPCGIKGEVHERYAAGMVTCRLTAQRFVTDVATTLNDGTTTPANAHGGSVFGQNLNANIPASGNSPSWQGKSVTFNLYTISGTTNQGFFITGEGFITRVTAANPRGAATEAFELQSDKMPTWTN